MEDDRVMEEVNLIVCVRFLMALGSSLGGRQTQALPPLVAGIYHTSTGKRKKIAHTAAGICKSFFPFPTEVGCYDNNYAFTTRIPTQLKIFYDYI